MIEERERLWRENIKNLVLNIIKTLSQVIILIFILYYNHKNDV